MKTIIFDGKAEAKKILDSVKTDVIKFKKEYGRSLNLVSIIVGEMAGNIKYSNLKKVTAENIEINFKLKEFPENTSVKQIIEEIKKLNQDAKIDGLMIQLPLPEHFTKMDLARATDTIDPKKDIDGMREESDFTAPVVLAVYHALKSALSGLSFNKSPIKVLVIGADGFVGSKIVKKLEKDSKIAISKADINKFESAKADFNTRSLKDLLANSDVIISATGNASLVTPSMVKTDVIAIDVGSPNGDVDKSVYKKASFITPVPGGIGPLTISYLMQNVTKAANLHQYQPAAA